MGGREGGGSWEAGKLAGCLHIYHRIIHPSIHPSGNTQEDIVAERRRSGGLGLFTTWRKKEGAGIAGAGIKIMPRPPAGPKFTRGAGKQINLFIGVLRGPGSWGLVGLGGPGSCFA